MSILLNTNDVLRKIFGTSEYFADMSSVENFLAVRLFGDQSIGQGPPFEYLVGCHGRVLDQIKEISSIGDDTVRSSLDEIVRTCKKLVVGYCRLYLNDPNLFLHFERRLSSSQLIIGLVLYGESCMPGLLENLFRDADFDGMETVFQEMYEDLRNRMSNVSLGDFQNSLKALKIISNFPNGGRALVNHELWIPNRSDHYEDGRMMEMISTLGPFFRISAIPDFVLYENENNVGKYDHCHEYARASKMIQDGLGEILMSLLKNSETRERVLEYLAEMINKNSARSQSHSYLHTCASSGTFVNLSIVMIRHCESFLDSNHNIDIDPSYVFSNTRIDFTQLTSLHASSQEFAELKQSNGAGMPDYTLFSEYFFMTSRVLHLGIIKAISEYKAISQEFSEKEKNLSKLKNKLDGNHPCLELKQEIAHLQKHIDELKKRKSCYEAQLVKDITYLKGALGFYRLVLLWLVDLVGGFEKPLSPTCPMLFACMPEHFVDDAMELLLFAFEVPKGLDGIILDDYVKFIIMFMASPQYIRNPYLRAKMAQVLKLLIKIKSTKPPFQGNEVLTMNLARNCLKLYVDIEVTGSHDKFKIRNNISELLTCLWKVPTHQTAWIEMAKIENVVYLNFINFLINDSSYLLGESLNAISNLKRLKAEMSNEDEWKRRPAQEREKKLQRVDSLKHVLQRDFPLAMQNVRILESTIQLTTAPFLLPEMVETVANTLNVFLSRLTHRERKFLNLKGYRSLLRELLNKIVGLYIHLERGDGDNALSAAISRDGRSYNPKLFTNAVNILSERGADIGMVQEFAKIGEKANTAALEALSVEEALGDIPNEFLDPIQYTLMKDPVILPSSKLAIDRHVIQRHLLRDASDPFNRSYLTQDMLIPDIELKANIEEFVRSKTQGFGR